MKKQIITILAICTLLFGIFIGNIFDIPKDAYAEETVKNTITVKGTATVTATPSLAYVHIGVTTFNADAVKAQQENATKMTNVMAALKKLGIADKDIKTSAYTIYPQYEWVQETPERGKSVITGYNVNNSIQVTVKDLSKVSKVLDTTVAEGVNSASSIVYSISEEEKDALYLEALKKATIKAKDKASTLASIYNININKPSQIVEEYNSYPITYDYKEMLMAADAARAVATPVSAGEITVGASVNVSYTY